MAYVTSLVNKDKVRERVQAQLEDGGTPIGNHVFTWSLFGTLIFTCVVLAVLVWTVVSGSWEVFADRPLSFLTNGAGNRVEDWGITQALRGTLWIGICVALFTFPVGIAAALYLEEYAGDNFFSRLVNVNIRNLAGVPSVVYGLLGLTVFVQVLNGVASGENTSGRTLLAGGLTLAVLSLPVVIITASEAIRAVPTELKQAAYGVGATKSEVVRSHILPHAAPGILTGSLLALARALGETAPLIVIGAVSGKLGRSTTAFWSPELLTERFTAMPILITDFISEAGDDFTPLASAAIVVLLLVVLGFNLAAVLLRNYFETKREGR